ncbi:MAG: DUF4870 domain-containing protein [Nitrospirae bacterium]|nr:DUF4870 domain-containing protein [Nitrospirota bacterium]
MNNKNDEKKERIWGMLCHLTVLLGITGIPFGNIIGPLIIWLVKRKLSPFVNEQGKESLNFQLSMTIYVLIAALFISMKIGFIFLFILVSINLILVIIASVKAYTGENYSYPFKIKFIR